jgi:hypothetical protein
MDSEQQRNEERTVTELIEMNRNLIANNERYGQALAAVLRILAADTITICDLASPTDTLEVAMIRDCRQRAQRILAGLGAERELH